MQIVVYEQVHYPPYKQWVAFVFVCDSKITGFNVEGNTRRDALYKLERKYLNLTGKQLDTSRIVSMRPTVLRYLEETRR